MQSETSPRSPWPAIALVLWVLWLLAMAFMSRNEWTKPRHWPHDAGTTSTPAKPAPRSPEVTR